MVVGLKQPAPARTGVTVRGRVNDGIRETFATAELVRLSQIPGTLFSDGSYEFRNVVPGRHLLEVSEGQPGDRIASAELTVAGADIFVNTTYTARPAAAVVKGRFIVEGGGAVNYAGVLLGSGQPAIVAAADGTFETTLRAGEYPLAFSVLPAGFMVKSIVFGSMLLAERNLVVDGAALPQLTVTLAPVPRIRLRVAVKPASPTTRSVAYAQVKLNGPATHQTVVGADGTFEISLLPGAYELEIYPFGFTTVRESVLIEPGKDLDLEFTSRSLY